MILTIQIILTSIIILSVVLLIRKVYKSKYFNLILKRLDGMLREKNDIPEWSFTRVKSIFVILLSNMIIWGIVLFGTIWKWQFIEIPEMVGIVYLSINGIEVVGKIYNKKFEQKGE